MFPTLTVQPGMSVLPAGTLNVLQGFVPSKLPFWNGAANAQPGAGRIEVRGGRWKEPVFQFVDDAGFVLGPLDFGEAIRIRVGRQLGGDGPVRAQEEQRELSIGLDDDARRVDHQHPDWCGIERLLKEGKTWFHNRPLRRE